MEMRDNGQCCHEEQRPQQQSAAQQQQQHSHTPHQAAAEAWAAGITRLHEEILMFQRWAAPRPAEVAARTRLLRRLRVAVRRLWPTAKLQVFGSFRTGLYLPSSDLDLVLLGNWRSPPLRELQLALSELASSVTVLDKAAVPLVKMTDAETGLCVDISFSSHTGVQAAGLICQFAASYPCLPPLLLVLKQFLLQRRLNSVWTGGVSSYALTLMIVSFLQQRPNDRHLGLLLLQFLELYGLRFDYFSTGIRVSDGGAHLPKNQLRLHSPAVLTIEDPLLPSNDVGRSSYGALRVKREFQLAFFSLCDAASNAGRCPALPSIIGCPRRPQLLRCCQSDASDDSDQSDSRPGSQ